MDIDKVSEVVGLPSTSSLTKKNEALVVEEETQKAVNKSSAMCNDVIKEEKRDFACFIETNSDRGRDDEMSTSHQDDVDIDEGYSGEAWVLGLVEGEYSSLSVEERLHALVSLVGLAIEGNSIRMVLEV